MDPEMNNDLILCMKLGLLWLDVSPEDPLGQTANWRLFLLV